LAYPVQMSAALYPSLEVSSFDQAIALIYGSLNQNGSIEDLLTRLHQTPENLDLLLEPHLVRAVEMAKAQTLRQTSNHSALAIYSSIGTCLWSRKAPGAIPDLPQHIGSAGEHSESLTRLFKSSENGAPVSRYVAWAKPSQTGFIQSVRHWPDGLDTLPPEARALYSEGHRLVVLTEGPDRNTLISLVGNHLDLTTRQIELVVQLALDGNLKTACATLSMRYETGRGHLRDAFKRTGIRSQIELIHLIWRLALTPPPELRSTNLPPSVRERIKLFSPPEGGVLSYSEGGKPAGRPVVMFHQATHAMLISDRMDAAAKAQGIRLICPDRFGFGLSAPATTARGIRTPDHAEEDTRQTFVESNGIMEACLRTLVDAPVHLIATGAGCAVMAGFAAQTQVPVASTTLVIPRRNDRLELVAGSYNALSLLALMRKRPRIGRLFLNLLRWLNHRPSLEALLFDRNAYTRVDSVAITDDQTLSYHIDAVGWTLHGNGAGPIREAQLGAIDWPLPDLPKGMAVRLVQTDEQIVPHDPEIKAWVDRHGGTTEFARDLGYTCYLAEPERVLGLIRA